MASTLDQYAVIGNPIEHSKSPQIHSLFAKQTQQSLQYTKLLAPLDHFKNTVLTFQTQGGKGCNVTVPFKQEAWALVSTRTPEAERAGAVNTLAFRADGSIIGHNTDGIGLIRDITQNQNITLTHKRILVLGAGGAVRGILQPFLAQKPSEIVIANRTLANAQELVTLFADLGQLTACNFTEVQGTFDLIINGTAASLQGELPPISSSCIKTSTLCYDMMYGAKPTVFMQWAKAQGCEHISDGLGMLVEQAAEAFLFWRDILPETKTVLAQLRAELK